MYRSIKRRLSIIHTRIHRANIHHRLQMDKLMRIIDMIMNITVNSISRRIRFRYVSINICIRN